MSANEERGSGPALMWPQQRNVENYMELKFLAVSENEGFARVCAGAFAAQLDPTVEEVSDIRTAVSEAITNAIVHAYPEKPGEVTLRGTLMPGRIHLEVEDAGIGIADVEAAMEPFYTTVAGEERSGMGFTVMQTFMDRVMVESKPGKGTLVRMEKAVGKGRA